MSRETIMKVEDTTKNMNLCLDYCGNCPSYSHVEGDGLYCARGESKSWIDKSECLCSRCSIFEMYGLQKMFFCAEKEHTREL